MLDDSVVSYVREGIVENFLADVNAASQLHYDTLSNQFGPVTADHALTCGDIWNSFSRRAIVEEILSPLWRQGGLVVPKDHRDLETFRRQLKGKPVPSTWQRKLSPEQIAQTPKATRERDCIIKAYLELARDIHDRKFITTHNGFQGRASMDVQAGDLLCIIFRCGQPLVLRPFGVDTHGEQIYKLVGSAWIPGIMNGEFLEHGNIMPKRFTLA